MITLSVLNIVSLLLVIAMVVVGSFGPQRIRRPAIAGGVFWVAGLLSTFLPGAIGMHDAAFLLGLVLSGFFHIMGVAALVFAAIRPAPHPQANYPRYDPNRHAYGTGPAGGYDHLPRAGEGPPRNLPH